MMHESKLVNYYDVYLKPVLICWFFISAYCIAAIVFPYSGTEGVAYGAALLILFVSFYLIFSFSFIGICSKFLRGRKFSLEAGGDSVLPFLLSIIGIAFIVIDRIYFRGIDFVTMSPAEIRNKITAESTGGVSSIFSIVGNILQCFVVISAFNSIFNDAGYRLFFKQGVFLMVVFGSSYLLGGRTPLMTYLVIVFSIYVSSGRAVSVFSALKFIFPAFFVALIFALSIFSLRASAVGINSDEYLSAMLAHLGAKNTSVNSSGGEFGTDALNFLYVVLAYLLHPFWVASEIVVDTERGGHISFYALLFLFSKFFSIDLGGAKHAYYELFSSLPGGLYYDFGFFGVLFYSLFLAGFGFLGLVFLAVSKGASKFGFVVIVFCLGTLFLSPLLHSLNFVFFVFYMAILFVYAIYKDVGNMFSCKLIVRRCEWKR